MTPNGYQKLSNEEEEIEEQTTTQEEQVLSPETTAVNIVSPQNDAPPPYVAGDDPPIVIIPSNEDILNQSPPLYADIVKLPTYNESENIEDTDSDERTSLRSIFYFVNSNARQQDISEDTLGTDIGFILCFLFAFVFNGLGFIFAYCSTNTLSSHYGAISGFGLSLVKWAFIIKHKELMQEYFQGNEWLLYCIILLGWLIFLRGILAYAQLKRHVYSRARLGRGTGEQDDIVE